MSKVKIKLDWNGPQINELVHHKAAKGLRAAANVLLDESRKEVPHDYGTLEGTGDVDVDEPTLSATVSYDTPYAVRWHECDANFQRGRKKKYLEDPLNNNRDRLLEYIKQQMTI